MDYTLEAFCTDCRAALDDDADLTDRLARIADCLGRLLANPAFVSATFDENTPPGQRTLHHDPTAGFYVLAHVQRGGKRGAPHSHGESWAIYGNARGYTDMTEWRRVNGADEERVVLEPAARYRLDAGRTHAYGPGVIHSTAHPEKAWVIRVTGTDLDSIPRYHFRPQRDQILEGA
jgi:predicted metal-dependent enzyme (double-stranded beta helix superfamily)